MYEAFISYSHAADGQLAPAIQRALHRLARPWYKVLLPRGAGIPLGLPGGEVL